MKLPIFITLTASWLSGFMHVDSAICNRDCHESCGTAKKRCTLSVLLLLLLLLTLTPVTVHGRDIPTCHGGAIAPRDSFFFSGQNIVLTCKLDKQPINRKTRLRFRRGSDNETVPNKYITLYNSTTIKVSIPLLDEDIPSYKKGMGYKCYKEHPKKGEKCIDNVIVEVDYHPVKPENLTCRIYNLQSMECHWSLVKDYVFKSHSKHKTKVACQFVEGNSVLTNLSYVGDVSYNGFNSCPNQTSTSCYWNDADYTDSISYYIRVQVTKENISEKTNYTFQSYDIFEPGTVTNLTVIPEDGSRCMLVHWIPPKPLRVRNSTYILTYNSTCDVETHSVNIPRIIQSDEKNNRMSTKICALNPHTSHELNIKSRLVYDGNETGYWSQYTSTSFWTPSDMPDVSPVSSSLQFELKDADNAFVYWQPLEPCEMHSSTSELYYNISHSKGIIGGAKFSTVVKVSDVTNVTIAAYNKNGTAKQISSITVFPKHKSPKPSDLVIQYNVKECRSTVAIVIVKENNFTNITHELVWCRGHTSCDEPLNKITLARGVTTYDSGHCDGNYRYGLVTKGYRQGDERSSGIYWNNCEYQLGKVPDEPLSVSLSTLQPHNGVLINWQKYECTKDNTGFITGYTVAFCLDRNNGKQCNCTRQIRTNVSSEASSYTIDNLDKGENVCVWIRGESLAGPGPYNVKPLIHTVTSRSDESSNPVWIVILVVTISVAVIGGFAGLRLKKKLRVWYRRETNIKNIIPIESTLNTSINKDGNRYNLNEEEQHLLRPMVPNIRTRVINGEEINSATNSNEPLLQGYTKATEGDEYEDTDYEVVAEEMPEESGDTEVSRVSINTGKIETVETDSENVQQAQQAVDIETVEIDPENAQSDNVINDSGRKESELKATRNIEVGNDKVIKVLELSDNGSTNKGNCDNRHDSDNGSVSSLLSNAHSDSCHSLSSDNYMQASIGNHELDNEIDKCCGEDRGQGHCDIKLGQGHSDWNEPCQTTCKNTTALENAAIESPFISLQTHGEQVLKSSQRPMPETINSHIDHLNATLEDGNIDNSVVLKSNNCADWKKEKFPSDHDGSKSEKAMEGSVILPIENPCRISNSESDNGMNSNENVPSNIDAIFNTQLPNLAGSCVGKHSKGDDFVGRACDNSIKPRVHSINGETCLLPNHGGLDQPVVLFENDKLTERAISDVRKDLNNTQETPVISHEETISMSIESEKPLAAHYHRTTESDSGGYEYCTDSDDETIVENKDVEDNDNNAHVRHPADFEGRNQSHGSRDSGRESLSADTEKAVDTDQQYSSLESQDSGHDSTHAINNSLPDLTTNNSDLGPVDDSKDICDVLIPKRNSGDLNYAVGKLNSGESNPYSGNQNSETSSGSGEGSCLNYMIITDISIPQPKQTFGDSNDNTKGKKGSNNSHSNILQMEDCKLKHGVQGKQQLETTAERN